MEKDPQRPPTNPVHAWMRLVMWLLPTGFAWGTAVGLGSIGSPFRIASDYQFALWLALNIAFIVGAGWYRAALLVQEEGNPDWNFGRVVAFFGIQLFLIPPLSVIILFAICVANPIKI